MDILQNIELKYRLEQFLQEKPENSDYILCIIKYHTCAQELRHDVQNCILNLISQDPVLSAGTCGIISSQKILLAAEASDASIEEHLDKLLTQAHLEKKICDIYIGAVKTLPCQAATLENLYQKALRSLFFAESSNSKKVHLFSEDDEKNFINDLKDFWQFNEDISDINFMRKIQEDEKLSACIQHIKQYDKVTMLPDYDYFLNTALHIVQNNKCGFRFAVLYADMMGFKTLNNIYGEHEGNRMLASFADFLCRQSFYICGSRVYADNFVMLLTIPEELTAQQLAQEFILESDEFLADERIMHPKSFLGFVCGLCEIKDLPESLHPYISRADQARKSLKPTFISKCCVFTDEMEAAYQRRQYLSDEIIKGLENDRFYFLLQPQIDTHSGKILGAEALARMESSDHSEILMPGEFIPLMEEAGDVRRFDFMIYEKVCRYLQSRMQKGLEPFSISVNVSREHFKNPNFAQELHQLAQQYGIEPHYLGLEITENIFIENIQEIACCINHLKTLGYPILLDDFGSGFSSLNVLKDIAFDIIKLDKQFLSDQKISSANYNIVQSIVKLSEALHIDVICEGVETATHVRFLNEVGCCMAQGFYYEKPVSIEAFETLLEQEKKREQKEENNVV